MNKLKILVFAGSLSEKSINKKLAKWASNELKNMGIDFTYIDINDYPLPIYSYDISGENFPENAKRLESLMKDHNVWLIASPEHNYSMTSCLKNILDFVSRAPDNESNLELFKNKIVGLMSASPSGLGGLRSLKQLNDMLSLMGCFVMPSQVRVASAYKAFNELGELVDSYAVDSVKALLKQLVGIANKLV